MSARKSQQLTSDLLTTTEVMAWLRCDRYRALKLPIPRTQLGPRTILFKRSDVEAYLAKHTFTV